MTIPDVSDREDCTATWRIASKGTGLSKEMHIPANCKGWVTGNRGSELRRMEHERLVLEVPRVRYLRDLKHLKAS